MINFFKKKSNADSKINDNSFTKIAALLIHAAKIDEVYTKEEEVIIKKTLTELGAESSNINELIADAAIIEENSNQILDFTREIKNTPEVDKIKIVECLWKIIYSNNIADVYEDNLMRRLAGLLYIDSKTMGEIKERVKMEFTK
tara:strand:+ start:744 stop:1175 length:432 start_codon:yes stop_codon:yes gene_type:complete